MYGVMLNGIIPSYSMALPRTFVSFQAPLSQARPSFSHLVDEPSSSMKKRGFGFNVIMRLPIMLLSLGLHELVKSERLLIRLDDEKLK